MKYRLRIAYVYGMLGVAGFFAFTIWLGALNNEVAIFLTGVLEWLPVEQTVFLDRFEAAGIFAIGAGVGIMAWVVTGQGAFRCLVERAPRAWLLWRRNVLTSLVPVVKYTLVGLLLGALGGYLVQSLWALWTGAYSAGLGTGVAAGAMYSVTRLRRPSQMNFLEANQRYINDEKVSVFTETEKP